MSFTSVSPIVDAVTPTYSIYLTHEEQSPSGPLHFRSLQHGDLTINLSAGAAAIDCSHLYCARWAVSSPHCSHEHISCEPLLGFFQIFCIELPA